VDLDKSKDRISVKERRKNPLARTPSSEERSKRKVKKPSLSGSKKGSKIISWSASHEEKINLDPNMIADIKKQINEATTLTVAVAEAFTKLWRHSLKKQYFKVSHLLPHNVSYFMDNIVRTSAEDYIPSSEDIIHSYVQTNGIMYKEGEFEQYQLLLAEVGGGRVEQRKWKNFFEEEHWDAIVFVVAMDEYDKPLESDPTKTYLEESIRVWKEITSLDKIHNIPFFLILNKSDLLITKLAKKLSKPFPIDEIDYCDFQFSKNFEFSVQFLTQKFAAHFGGIHFIPFVTNAQERSSCEHVLSSMLQLL